MFSRPCSTTSTRTPCSSMDDLDADQKEEQVKSLFAASDKFGMERMKLMCASILCKELKVENVATTLALADQHHYSQLKNVCIGFINSTDRLRDVMEARDISSSK